jgi:hypothetical protein
MESSQSIMQYLAHRFFNSECYISKAKFKDKSGFSIHHYDYINGDLKWNQFPKGEKGKKAYLNHLKKQIEKQPENYVLIKKMYHTLIDAYPKQCSRIMGLSRIKADEWERLKEVVEKTKRKR